MSRIIVVSNRLPITVRGTDDGLEVKASVGGLATGLLDLHLKRGAAWIGWAGELAEGDAAAQAALAREAEARRLVPVVLPPRLQKEFYEDFANGVLWPLFHYRAEQLPLFMVGWEAYQEANRLFADAVVAAYQPGDLVWVHDYHLFLVPQMIRERIPDARIGFFLHVPFPTVEMFRILPMREAVVRGMLGADLIGFHTAGYRQHFATAARIFAGVERRQDILLNGERRVQLGVFPMGIEAEEFDRIAREPEIIAEAAAQKGEGALLLGIDRLDYTKGIARRLAAFERLLEKHPELHGRVRLVQVAVPSREGVEAYQQLRTRLDEQIGRINGRFATPSWVPLNFLSRGFDRRQLVALYRAADVMLVTPLRDGMNLVAKEFAASRPDERGVLVLSQLAGASLQLDGALVVNPYDADGTADTILRALELPAEEQRRRMRRLRSQVRHRDIHWWANAFLATLAQPVGERGWRRFLSWTRSTA